MQASPDQLEAQLDNGLIMGHAYSVTDIRMVSVSFHIDKKYGSRYPLPNPIKIMTHAARKYQKERKMPYLYIVLWSVLIVGTTFIFQDTL